MRSLCRWRTLAPGVLVLSLILTGPARAGDPLTDEVKARQQVDAQRIQKVVSDAELEASRLAQSKKLADAVAVLRSALDQVENATSLPEDRRDGLKRRLNGLIKAFDPSTAPPPVVKTPVIQPRTPVDDRRGPVDAASGVFNSRSGSLADNRLAKLDKDKAILGVGNEVYKSSTPPTMDYNLPADWVEKSKRRSKQVQLTERERAILRELNTTRSVEFKGETFQEVINYLSKTTGQTITVPKNVLEEVGVTYDTPIKLELKNVTTRSILKKMLAELNLTYIIKDEAIEITTPERASRTLTTRTYYVGDLVAAFQDRNLPLVYARAQMVQQINSLAAMIINTYDPDSWQARGGPGSITFDPITMSFVVRQTAEMHYLMGVGMR